MERDGHIVKERMETFAPALEQVGSIKELVEFFVRQGYERIPSCVPPLLFNEIVGKRKGLIGVSYLFQVICYARTDLETYYCGMCNHWTTVSEMFRHLRSATHRLNHLKKGYEQYYKLLMEQPDKEKRDEMLSKAAEQIWRVDGSGKCTNRMKCIITEPVMRKTWPHYANSVDNSWKLPTYVPGSQAQRGNSDAFYQRSRDSDVSCRPRRSSSAMPTNRLPNTAQSTPLPSVPRTREASVARDCNSARPATACSSHNDQWTFPKIGGIGKGICYKSRKFGRFTLYASGPEPRAIFERARDENDPSVEFVLEVYYHDQPDEQRVVTCKPRNRGVRVPEAVDMTCEKPRIVEIDMGSMRVARSHDDLSNVEQKAYKMLLQFAQSRLAKYWLLHAFGTRQFEVRLMYNGDVRLALPDANAVYNPKSKELVPRSGTQLTQGLETLFMDGVRYILQFERDLNLLPRESRRQFLYGPKITYPITREPPPTGAPNGRA